MQCHHRAERDSIPFRHAINVTCLYRHKLSPTLKLPKKLRLPQYRGCATFKYLGRLITLTDNGWPNDANLDKVWQCISPFTAHRCLKVP